MTTRCITLFLSLALIFAAGQAAAESGSTHWGYFGDIGPSHWGDLSADFATCKTGREQSPVNLGRGEPANLRPLQIHYRASSLELVNNGHTVQVNVEPGSWLRFNNKEYELQQFHFHTPSEHEVYARELPLEIHFVHKSRDGELAVIGVLARFSYRPHMALNRIWEYLPMPAGEKSNAGGIHLNPISLLPMKRDYLTYQGSLTTPPCSEGVRWIVFREPVRISDSQVRKFTRAVGDNARPVQPLNGRTVSAFR
jgi:carbonic anhydrase